MRGLLLLCCALPALANPGGYLKVCSIQINHGQVAANASNFPVYFTSTTLPSCQAAMRSVANGGVIQTIVGGVPWDVFIADRSDTLLPAELVNYSPTTGSLQGYVNIAALSASSDTFFNIWIGKAGDTNHWNPHGTWNANYQAVWHETPPSAQFAPPVRAMANPILVASPTGSINDPNVMNDPSVTGGLLMFYDVYGAGNIYLARASSVSPTAWTPDPANPIITPTDPARVDSVLYTGGTFYIYSSNQTTLSVDVFSSTSPNGPWTYTPNVLTPSGQGCTPPGAIWVGQAAVIQDGAGYSMVYAYRVASLPPIAYQSATASSPLGPWTKQGGCPNILATGIFGSADYGGMEQHQLQKIGGNYYLVYECYSGANDSATGFWSICFAESPSLTGPWVKSGGNGLFTNSGVMGTFDQWVVATPFTFQIGANWWLFYQGNFEENWTTGYYSLGMAEMGGDPTTGFPAAVLDSTANNYNLVDVGTGTATPFLGAGRTFDGVTEHQGTQTNVLTTAGNYTVEAWVKLSSTSGGGSIFHAGAENNITGGEGYGFTLGSGTLQILISTVVSVNTGYTFTDTNWHWVVLTNSGGTTTAYVDGVAQSGTTMATAMAPTGEFHIGSIGQNSPSGFFGGSITEVRASSAAVGANWIQTQYANQSSPATFYGGTLDIGTALPSQLVP